VETEDGSQHKDIRIGQIREVERTVALKPYEGRRRVVIIDPADALNVEAQNAFLKTLEEPPPDVTFVLITAREAALLPTIRSRCQRVAFRVLSVGQIEAALRQGSDLDAEEARLLARLAGGRLGWALNLAHNQSPLAERAEALATARQLPAWSLAQRFDLAEGLASRFYRQRQFVFDTLDIWRQWWRDVLLSLCEARTGITNVDMTAALDQEAHRYASQEVVHFLRAIGAAKSHLEDNVNPRLALEALLLQVPSLQQA
jgi:DNA polymerase-3 subunit delta'